MTLSAGAVGTVAGGRRWTPLELGSAVTVWYDASDAATVTLTDSKVSQLDDKSGNARHATQGTADNRPVVASAVQNGLDGLRFYEDSTNDWLSVPSTGVTAQPYAIFAVLRYNAASSPEMVFMNSSGPSFQDDSQNRPEIYAGTGLNAGVQSANWAIQGGVYNSTSSSVIWNGTVTTGNAGTSVISGATSRLGNRTDATTTSRFRGWLGEFLIYNGNPSTADRQRLEGYLAWKWGLTGNLPSNHPHKNIRP